MNKFKDNRGCWRTESLFIETNKREDKLPSIYALTEDKATEECPCLKTLYLSKRDPTEYLFVKECLGSWKQWEYLCSNSWFGPIVKEWRAELELLLIAEGVQKQRELAEKGNQNAAKWLAEKGWNKRKAGAPSREEVARERKIAAERQDTVEEDYNRIFN